MCRTHFGTAIAALLVAAKYDIRLLGKPAPGFDTAQQVRVFDGERAFKTIKQGGHLMSRSWKPIFCTALLLAVLGVLAPGSTDAYTYRPVVMGTHGMVSSGARWSLSSPSTS
jgi:hypothetical protein